MTRTPRFAVVIVVVSLLVVASVVIAAVLLRTARDDAAKATIAPTESSTPSAGLQCGRERCTLVASQQVGVDAVQLLADSQRRSGRVRIDGPAGSTVFETTITQSPTTTLTATSLNCLTGTTSVCLVRGTDGAETVGEVFIGRASAWTRAEIPFSAGGSYLALQDVTGDGTAEVVTDQHACGVNPPAGCTKVFVQVFALSGDTVGCTKTYSAENQLPGWPTLALGKAQLHACPQ